MAKSKAKKPKIASPKQKKIASPKQKSKKRGKKPPILRNLPSYSKVKDRIVFRVSAKLFQEHGYYELEAGKAKANSVRMKNAIQAIKEGQQESISVVVDSFGNLSIENGRHRLAAAIKLGAKILVKFLKALPSLDVSIGAIRRGKKPKSKVKSHKSTFEGRKKTPEAPPEFTISPSALSQEEAYATINARLQSALHSLPEGLTGKVILHPYVDGSVDGELYVRLPEDAKSSDIEWDLYEAFGALTVGQRYWISVGARYIIEADDEIYRRYRGMNQIQTNYQRANRANIVEEHLILRKKLLPGMERHYKREAHSLFIRLHWNPENVQPKR